jgi:uroporphyrinogen-III synthase
MHAEDNQIKSQLAPKPLTGLRVLSLESRRAQEMAKLISNYGGEAIVAPSMQEVPLTSHVEALDFVRELIEGRIYMVIFLTGVGTQMLARIARTRYSNENFVEALRKVAVVARGPKLAVALRELEVPVTVMIPEPNTWRDTLRILDNVSPLLPINGRRVAVQEYGTPNPELLAGLEERGAIVVRIPIYQWELPDDTAPLRAAIESIARGEIDVTLFTTSVQIVHLLRVAAEMEMEAALRAGLAGTAIGSVGPLTSEALRQRGLPVDFEPQHPKMGFLISEAAQRAPELVRRKRAERSVSTAGQ